jgi:hypothetical protein
VSDIDTVVVDSLKALDPKRPIREALDPKRPIREVDIEKQLARLRNSPEVVKRVSIVTSSLSKKAVEDAFADIKSGKRPTAHFVQLYWLLTSFFSACAEVGAAGYVICQP